MANYQFVTADKILYLGIEELSDLTCHKIAPNTDKRYIGLHTIT
jgi:hypothetical protein